MKAREIKKTLLHNYEGQINVYKGNMSRSVREMAVNQAKIKQLESILLSCFGIEKEFDFNFVYDAVNVAKLIKEMDNKVNDIPYLNKRLQ